MATAYIPRAPGDTRDNLRGILLMVACMAGFAVEDMFIKLAAGTLPTGQILMMLSVFGTPVFAALARRQGARIFVRDALAPAVLWRNAGEMIGSLGFVTALALTPISSASAILQAAPLAVTLGAALVLGEPVGWRRWSAIVVGFLGVLLIVRPGMDGFMLASLWAVLGVAGMSVRDLATRRVPGHITTMQVAAWGFIAVGLLGAAMLTVSGGAVVPSPRDLALIGGALSFGIASYWAVIAAMRLGEVSVIAPFRYARLIFALAIGVLVFGERPDALTLAGAALVIGSGLYTFARERIRKRALSTSAPAG